MFAAAPLLKVAFLRKTLFPGPVVVFCLERFAGLAFRKALPAVHRTIADGPEGNFAFFIAVRADRLMQGPFLKTALLLSFAVAGGVIEALERF